MSTQQPFVDDDSDDSVAPPPLGPPGPPLPLLLRIPSDCLHDMLLFLDTRSDIIGCLSRVSWALRRRVVASRVRREKGGKRQEKADLDSGLFFSRALLWERLFHRDGSVFAHRLLLDILVPSLLLKMGDEQKREGTHISTTSGGSLALLPKNLRWLRECIFSFPLHDAQHQIGAEFFDTRSSDESSSSSSSTSDDNDDCEDQDGRRQQWQGGGGSVDRRHPHHRQHQLVSTTMYGDGLYSQHDDEGHQHPEEGRAPPAAPAAGEEVDGDEKSASASSSCSPSRHHRDPQTPTPKIACVGQEKKKNKKLLRHHVVNQATTSVYDKLDWEMAFKLLVPSPLQTDGGGAHNVKEYNRDCRSQDDKDDICDGGYRAFPQPTTTTAGCGDDGEGDTATSAASFTRPVPRAFGTGGSSSSSSSFVHHHHQSNKAHQLIGKCEKRKKKEENCVPVVDTTAGGVSVVGHDGGDAESEVPAADDGTRRRAERKGESGGGTTTPYPLPHSQHRVTQRFIASLSMTTTSNLDPLGTEAVAATDDKRRCYFNFHRANIAVIIPRRSCCNKGKGGKEGGNVQDALFDSSVLLQRGADSVRFFCPDGCEEMEENEEVKKKSGKEKEKSGTEEKGDDAFLDASATPSPPPVAIQLCSETPTNAILTEVEGLLHAAYSTSQDATIVVMLPPFESGGTSGAAASSTSTFIGGGLSFVHELTQGIFNVVSVLHCGEETTTTKPRSKRDEDGGGDETNRSGQHSNSCGGEVSGDFEMYEVVAETIYCYSSFSISRAASFNRMVGVGSGRGGAGGTNGPSLSMNLKVSVAKQAKRSNSQQKAVSRSSSSATQLPFTTVLVGAGCGRMHFNSLQDLQGHQTMAASQRQCLLSNSGGMHRGRGASGGSESAGGSAFPPPHHPLLMAYSEGGGAGGDTPPPLGSGCSPTHLVVHLNFRLQQREKEGTPAAVAGVKHENGEAEGEPTSSQSVKKSVENEKRTNAKSFRVRLVFTTTDNTLPPAVSNRMSLLAGERFFHRQAQADTSQSATTTTMPYHQQQPSNPALDKLKATQSAAQLGRVLERLTTTTTFTSTKNDTDEEENAAPSSAPIQHLAQGSQLTKLLEDDLCGYNLVQVIATEPSSSFSRRKRSGTTQQQSGGVGGASAEKDKRYEQHVMGWQAVQTQWL